MDMEGPVITADTGVTITGTVITGGNYAQSEILNPVTTGFFTD
jgi:hypothetical protein